MKAKLVLIVCFYIAFFILSPPFQLPDESDHYQFVYLLARAHYPRLIPDRRTQGNQPFLNRLEATFDFTKVASRDFALPDYRKIGSFAAQNTPVGNRVTLPALSKQGHQPPLYYLAATVFFRLGDLLHLPILSQFYLVRLTSALFYFLTVLLAYRLFSLFLQSRSSQNLMVFFAVNPLVVKMGVTVNPDIMVLFFSLLFLYLCLVAVTRKKYVPPYLFALVAGAAILTKFEGIFLVPFYAGYLLVRKVPWRQLFRSCLVFFLGVLAVTLPWLMFNLRTYGRPVIDNFALMCKQELPPAPLPVTVLKAVLEFRHSLMHYAGFWGWGEPYPFKPFFIVYALVMAAVVTAGIVVALRKRTPPLLILAGFTACLFLFLFPVSLQHKLERYSCDIQGRYLLPVFPAMSLIGVAGIVRLLKSKEETVTRAMMLFAIFQAQLVLWYVVIPKYYV